MAQKTEWIIIDEIQKLPKLALQNSLKLPLTPQTISYGDLFEQFIILEFIRLNDYFESRYRFSYFLTKDGSEIDLVIERPGKPLALVDIKSTAQISDDHSSHLKKLAPSFKKAELFVLNNSTQALNRDNVQFRPWENGIRENFSV